LFTKPSAENVNFLSLNLCIKFSVFIIPGAAYLEANLIDKPISVGDCYQRMAGNKAGVIASVVVVLLILFLIFVTLDNMSDTYCEMSLESKFLSILSMFILDNKSFMVIKDSLILC